MIIEITDDKLQFVRPILRRVADRYRQLLIHREILSGKLRELRVLVRWMTPEDDMQGFYRLNYDRERVSHSIELHIDRRDSEKSIAFLFAHELSHMLLHGSGDYVRCLAGETEIPYCLQESMADNMADYVVSRCRFSDKTCTYMMHLMEDSYCREFAQLLAEGFGSPLETAKYLDDFAITEIQTEQDAEAAEEENDSFWDAYFAQLDATCPVDLWVHNYFWYLSVLGRFHEIPPIFDEYMGEGTFEQVLADMNFYHANVRNGTAPDVAQRSLSEEHIDDAPERAKRRALALIGQFVQLRTQEWEENGSQI